MYNSSYHHWFTSIIHFISGMHFISRRHHINKYDVTNHTRSFYPMDHSLTDPLTFKHRQSVIATCMPVSVTYNNEFPNSNMTDDSLSEELSPGNHAQGRQTTTLDIFFDPDHLDYSVLGNVDRDLNILLDNNSINCRYFTEMGFNNNSFIDTNFSLFKYYVNLQHFLEGLNISFAVLSFTETWLSEYNTSLYNFKGYSHIYKLRDKKKRWRCIPCS